MAITYYICKDDDMLDAICWQYYGNQSGMLEAVLNANPLLANKGHKLKAGTKIILPEITNTNDAILRLWD